MLFKKTNWQEPIARTGFLVSLVAYVLFWSLDIYHPGFVARFFSVHIFLLSSLVFGFWWSSVVVEFTERLLLERICVWIIGVIMCIMVWQNSSDLGGARGVISLISFFIPWIVWRIIRYK